jgi:hypothetical protein
MQSSGLQPISEPTTSYQNYGLTNEPSPKLLTEHVRAHVQEMLTQQSLRAAAVTIP